MATTHRIDYGYLTAESVHASVDEYLIPAVLKGLATVPKGLRCSIRSAAMAPPQRYWLSKAGRYEVSIFWKPGLAMLRPPTRKFVLPAATLRRTFRS